jgi:hypothetical protein
VIKSENLAQKPKKIPYNSKKMSYFHYGATIERFIATACTLPEGEERTELISAIANNMKKNLLAWNKEVADDRKVLEDLRKISKGKINVNADEFRLMSNDDFQRNRLRSTNTNNNNKNGRRIMFKKKQN